MARPRHQGERQLHGPVSGVHGHHHWYRRWGPVLGGCLDRRSHGRLHRTIAPEDDPVGCASEANGCGRVARERLGAPHHRRANGGCHRELSADVERYPRRATPWRLSSQLFQVEVDCERHFLLQNGIPCSLPWIHGSPRRYTCVAFSFAPLKFKLHAWLALRRRC
jgi:hypothetical protein